MQMPIGSFWTEPGAVLVIGGCPPEEAEICVASSLCSNTDNQWVPSAANALGPVSTEGPLGADRNPAPAPLTAQLCTGSAAGHEGSDDAAWPSPRTHLLHCHHLGLVFLICKCDLKPKPQIFFIY